MLKRQNLVCDGLLYRWITDSTAGLLFSLNVSHLSFIPHKISSFLLLLNLFSLFCKLGVLVRHRISLFGKDVETKRLLSSLISLKFDMCIYYHLLDRLIAVFLGM